MTKNNQTKFKQTEIGEMPEQWDVRPSLRMAELISGGTPKTTNSEYWNGGIPWISVKDVRGTDRYVEQTEKSITQFGLENSSTNMLTRGATIISARGTVGEVAQLKEDMTFNQSCYGLEAKEGIDKDYLFYALKNSAKRIKSKTHGSVFSTITTSTFNNIILPKPELVEQKRIASILSSLDDKIELNRRMNKSLEEIGRALFRRWFVEFEFPYKVPLNKGNDDSPLTPLIEGGNPDQPPSMRGEATAKQGGVFHQIRRLPYNPKLKDRARKLRREMTKAEKKLWYEFLSGHKKRFLRQRPIDNFIVDFYCAEQGLVIEIDGDVHYLEGAKEKDDERTAVLEGYGLKVIRFTNDEVLKSFEGVCGKIEEVLNDSPLIEGGNPDQPPSMRGEATAKPEQGGVFSGYKSSGGKMVDSELGMIPEGWRVGKLGEEFEVLMGVSPKGKTLNEKNEGTVFFQGNRDFGFRFPTERVYTTTPKRIAPKASILISVRAPVGAINIANQDCCIGRGVAAVWDRGGNQSYCIYKMLQQKNYFERFNAEGTVFGSLTRSNLERLETATPSQDLIEHFDRKVRDIDEKIENNAKEIQNLSQLRDSLLPRLMSGKVRV